MKRSLDFCNPHPAEVGLRSGSCRSKGREEVGVQNPGVGRVGVLIRGFFSFQSPLSFSNLSYFLYTLFLFLSDVLSPRVPIETRTFPPVSVHQGSPLLFESFGLFGQC